ncbi:hypothetical protein SAZ11_56780 [Streptomyces sp. FXJ1.4098]|nr:hypothetical protein [Streptomyces sp. FXJ1.4098]
MLVEDGIQQHPGVVLSRRAEDVERVTGLDDPAVRMTATRSQLSATTPKLWVTSSTAMFISVCRSRSRSRISACTVTSSAVVGSSAMSSSGRLAIAPAMSTRWAMPPEIWCG